MCLAWARRILSRLHLVSRYRWPVSLTVHDDPGDLCETDRLPQVVQLDPWKEKTVSYGITPLKRGATHLQAIHLRFSTQFGTMDETSGSQTGITSSHLSGHPCGVPI